jgi:BRCA1-associated protein
MWVHRLIRDKGDDKIMELPPRGHGRGSDESNGTEEMDLVPREKLEGIGMEYTHLLTSQLESQRVYFEDLVSKAAAKASAASSSAAAASAQTAAAQTRLSALEAENQKLRDEVIVNLEKELAREKKKAERSSEIARGFGNSLREEKKVSEGLMDRIEFLNRGMEKMVGEMGVLKKEREELREENRDLMFSLTAGEKLKEMDLGEEVEGGTVVVPEVKEPSNSKKKGKGRGK